MYAMTLIKERMKPFQYGSDHEDRPAGTFFLQIFVLILSLFGGVFCMTCLYLAMRGLMRFGGMVASGGPYAIAHPAPGWAWILPGSVMSGVIFIGLNSFAVRRAGGLNILVLAWPAVFLSLGWNFLDFSIGPSAGHEPVWGWLVCGVVFFIMGGLALVFVLGNTVKALRGDQSEAAGSPWSGSRGFGGRQSRVRFSPRGRSLLVVLQLLAMGLGLFAADRFVRVMTRDKTVAAVENARPSLSSFPAPHRASRDALAAMPAFARPARIVITFEHNTLEILSGEKKLYYNGRAIDRPSGLPLEARQVLEQTAAWLEAFLRY
jgi:hypothetical protein